jgi:hypothetical protein
LAQPHRVNWALFALFKKAVSKDVVSCLWRKVKLDRGAWCARRPPRCGHHPFKASDEELLAIFAAEKQQAVQARLPAMAPPA